MYTEQEIMYSITCNKNWLQVCVGDGKEKWEHYHKYSKASLVVSYIYMYM